MTSVPNERPKRRRPRPIKLTVEYDEPSPEVLARQVQAVLYLLGRTDLDGTAAESKRAAGVDAARSDDHGEGER